MIRITAEIDSRNQIALPDEVRRHLHVEAGQQVVFVIDEERHTVAVHPPELTLEETFGSLRLLPNMSDDFDVEIEEAVAEAMDAKVERWRRQGIW